MKAIEITLWTSPHCPACPPAKKLAAKVVEKYPNVALTIKSIEDNEEEAQAFGINSLPTWVIMNDTDGHKMVGVGSLDKIGKSIEELAA